MIDGVGAMIAQVRAQELGVKIAPTPRCLTCGGEVHVESYVVTRPEIGYCVECKAPWEDTKLRGQLCPTCGYSLEEDAEGRGGCLPHD